MKRLRHDIVESVLAFGLLLMGTACVAIEAGHEGVLVE